MATAVVTVVQRETADNLVVKALVKYCFCGLKLEKITFSYYVKYRLFIMFLLL